MADEVLDVRQCHCVGFAAKTDRIPGGTGACSSTDAVHVVLGVPRQVIVDDALNVGNVQTTRGDVGANENLQIAALKLQ